MIQVMLVVLLSVVGALLILLHLRISQLRQAERSFKILSESLEGTITRARELMGQLKDDKSDSVTANMSEQLKTAHSALDDLKMMSARAEKLLEKFDDLEDQKKGGKPIKTKAIHASLKKETNGTGNGKDPLSTRPFTFTSQPLRTVSRGKSSALYQAASKVTDASDEQDEDIIKSTRSEAEKRLKQALQGRL